MRTPKKTLLVVAAAAAMAGLSGGGARAGIVAPSETDPEAHGHTFTVVRDPDATWERAQADAIARGGFLATIGDADEQRVIRRLLVKANVPTGAYWFGLHETSTEGEFRHVTNATPRFTNWLGGEPDNGAGAGENSAAVVWRKGGNGTSGRWVDLPNANPNAGSASLELRPAGYIIEFKGNGSSFDNGDRDPSLGDQVFFNANTGGTGGGTTGGGNGTDTGGGGGDGTGTGGTGGTGTGGTGTGGTDGNTGGSGGNTGGTGNGGTGNGGTGTGTGGTGTDNGGTGTGNGGTDTGGTGNGGTGTGGTGTGGTGNGGTGGDGGGMIPAPGTDTGGDNTGGTGNGGTGNGGTDTGGTGGGGGGTGGGSPNAIPLPAAAFLFPAGALVAGYAARRMRHGR
jgi:hypothetical protein